MEYFQSPRNIQSIYGKGDIELLSEWKHYLREKFK